MGGQGTTGEDWHDFRRTGDGQYWEGERRCLMQSVVAADDSQTATRAGQGQWKWWFLGGAEMPRSVSNWLL